MNVLVTGGAGYIGSVVVEQLIKNGHEVVVCDNLSEGHAAAIAPEATLVKADLSDSDTIARALDRNRIEAVIHLAASSLVGE
jgi:UDP-glucose 4-epimerase